jgi:hypothetical protein
MPSLLTVQARESNAHSYTLTVPSFWEMQRTQVMDYNLSFVVIGVTCANQNTKPAIPILTKCVMVMVMVMVVGMGM